MSEDSSDDDGHDRHDHASSGRQLSEKIAELPLFYQALLECQQELLIFSIDTAYRYISFNNTFRNGTHAAYGTTVTVGANLLDSVTREDDRRRIKTNCDRALKGEAHVTTEAYGDLTKHYYETKYHPVLDPDKQVVGVTAISSDITERVISERRLSELNKELEAFTYTVAHDLRAPLRIMNGYSGILKEDFGHLLNEEGNRLLDIIGSNCYAMSQLIDGLLNFSRLGRQSLHKGKVDMQQLVSETIMQSSVTGQRKTEFSVGDLEPANCDLDLMRQVLTNLISNAVKFSRNNERPLVEVGCQKQTGETIYYVRDNGAGFDMKYAHKLFGVFQRLHGVAEFEGTGVGLAIVARIIARHDGRIWAEAETGKGATFYFSLPAT